jgi:EAL domain-containing protein (putative c-di-GMP-specific phosphodiesterase class I)/DNA-binding NarL/FixJ family response regulator
VSPRPLAGWSALIIDDDVRARAGLREVLVAAGFAVLAAGDGDAALRVVQRHPVQLVLAEARVLAQERRDLVAALHRHAPDLHVIVLTEQDDPRVRDQLPGADAVIVKPFTSEELIEHLAGLVRSRVTRGSRGLVRSAGDAPSARPEPRAGARLGSALRDPAEAALVEDIGRGLDAYEFEVFYQPIVRLADQTTVGYEALCRWRHPVHGLLMPAAFIPVAERSGLIVELGDLVLATACEQARRWRAAGHDLHVAVNMSAKQLVDPEIVDRISELLLTTSLPPGGLWLEVTETDLIDDIPTAKIMLERIEAVGAWLSIDDFGTGWASLTYLRQFPSHGVKIDRSFVSGLGKNTSDEAIVRSILLLARELDLSVTAEGVESTVQATRLVELGCDLAQGYLFGHPSPVERLSLS